MGSLLLNIGILAPRSEGKNAQVAWAGAGRYGRLVAPSLFAALGLSLRGLARSPWLVAAGMVTSLLGRALTWPAFAAGGALLAEAAALAARGRPFDPGAPVQGAFRVLGSPAFLLLVGGLFLCGLAARGLLRVAWLAGALPQLGGAMSGEPSPRFAAGAAFGFARLLPTAVLGFALDLSGAGFSLGLALSALRVAARAAEQGGSPALAAATALALVLALLVPLALSVLADAAVARAALRGDGPLASFGGATRRFLGRPGTFVLASLGFGVAGLVGPAAIEAMGQVISSLAPGASPLVLAGPALMAAAAAALVSAAVDLGWLGTVAALTCARTAGR
jgi:hypothetical protein